MPTYSNIQAVCPTSGLSRTRTPNDGDRAQIALQAAPSADAKTIRARSTTRCAVVRERANRSRRFRSPRRKTTVRMGSGMTNNLQHVSILRKTLRPRYTSTGLRNVEMRSNVRSRSWLTPHSRAICAKGPRQASGGGGKSCGTSCVPRSWKVLRMAARSFNGSGLSDSTNSSMSTRSFVLEFSV